MVWGYGPSKDEEMWRGTCETREEAIAEARAEFGQDPFWIQEGTACTPEQFMPTASDLIEIIADRASDEAGEAADEFPDVDDEAEAELDSLLRSWAAKHLRPRFWIADGEPERIEPEHR